MQCVIMHPNLEPERILVCKYLISTYMMLYLQPEKNDKKNLR